MIDRIGSLGITKFGNNNRKTIMSFTLLLTLLVTLLIVAALAGWSTTYDTLKHTAWAYSSSYTDPQNEVTLYFGLQGIFLGNTFISYNCAGSYCENCQTGGNVVLGMYLISFFIMIGVIIGTILRFCYDSNLLKFRIIILLSGVWFFTFIGYVNWNEICYNSLPTGSGFILKHMAGFYVAICAWVFSTFVLILHLCTPITSTISRSSLEQNQMNNDRDVNDDLVHLNLQKE